MTSPTPERVALENATRALLEQGYQVIREPSSDAIPAFLEPYRPDLIAFKEGSPSLIIEVKRRGAHDRGNLAEIRHRFANEPDWEFRVIWVDLLGPEDVNAAPAEAILKRSSELKELFEAGHFGPALLICWAMLEGITRGYFPARLRKPHTPRSVVQILESEGLIDDVETRELRRLALSRNRLTHGDLEEEVTNTDILVFRDILARLMADLIATITGA